MDIFQESQFHCMAENIVSQKDQFCTNASTTDFEATHVVLVISKRLLSSYNSTLYKKLSVMIFTFYFQSQQSRAAALWIREYPKISQNWSFLNPRTLMVKKSFQTSLSMHLLTGLFHIKSSTEIQYTLHLTLKLCATFWL